MQFFLQIDNDLILSMLAEVLRKWHHKTMELVKSHYARREANSSENGNNTNGVNDGANGTSSHDSKENNGEGDGEQEDAE